MRELIIVGGGAAGLMCAVQAARRGVQPLVLEKMDRVGKKLLATGNGRCNLMNERPQPWPCGGDLAQAVLACWPARRQKEEWERLGLRLRTEAEGRVYPASGQASTVLDVLRLALDTCGVEVRTGCAVQAVRRSGGAFSVQAGGETLQAERVAVMGGGRAQPKLGSDGSAARLLQSLGHTILHESPSLCAIRTNPEPLAGLEGIRVRAEAALWQSGTCLHRESGEILFARDGVSGICVMNTSAWLADGPCELRLNLLPAMSLHASSELLALLERRCAGCPDADAAQLFTGLCQPRLAMALCRAAGLRWQGRKLQSLKPAELSRVSEAAAAFTLPVAGTRGFDQAQVTRGGADAGQFSPDTLESRLVPGLYAGGEVLDVDGPCGGYNLMFAFACGMTVAEAVGGCKP